MRGAIGIGFAVVAILSAAAVGSIRVPPPQFDTDYKMPSITTPPPGDRPGTYPFSPATPPLCRYIDAVLLSAVMAFGVYMVARKGPLHVLPALGGAIVLYFGLWHAAIGWLAGKVFPQGAHPAAEWIIALATPLIVLASVALWSVGKRCVHGVIIPVVLAAVTAGTSHDGFAGLWGILRRLAWCMGRPDMRPAVGFAIEYLDVALLAAAILLAAYFALKTRSRNAIVGVMIFSLLHFGFWRQGCICPIGAIQTAARAMFDRSYPISPIVALFFLIPLVSTFLLGRSFCAAVCPLGAIQDVVVLHPVKVPLWLQHALRMLAWVYLAAAVVLAAVGSLFIICQYDPFVAMFRLEGSREMVILGISFLVLGAFVARPYCRFLCPYGAILRVLSGSSWLRVKITPAECVQCRLCEDSCPFGAIRPANAAQPPRPRAEGKWVLAGLILLLPVLVLGGGWLGAKLGAPLARTHDAIRLAERISRETAGEVTGTTDATAALLAMEKSERFKRYREIHQEAREVEGRFAVGGWLFGAFVALVVGLKLIALSLRRRREDYEPEAAGCMACGRCYAHCPIEIQHRKRRDGLSE